MKQTLLMIHFFSSFLFGFTLTDTTSESVDSMALLLERVTQLELELEEMKRERPRNPISSGSYRKWGNGLSVAVEYPYLSAELGYTFKIIRQQMRLGFSGGYLMRNTAQGNWPSEYMMHGSHNLYWKVLVGSPVFFNLMSFSATLSQIYWYDNWTIDTSATIYEMNLTDNGEVVVVDTVGGFSVSSGPVGYISSTALAANAEFWISPKMNIYFGINVWYNRFTYDHDILRWGLGEEKYNEVWQDFIEDRWVSNSFKVGARYYFGSFREMNENRKNRKKK